MEKGRDQLAAARLWAANAAPYLATALFAMTPIIVSGSGTMGIDKHWRVYVDPVVFDRWPVATIGAALIHEAHHVLRSHSDRAVALGVGETEQRRFNVAADLEINDDLRELPLPEGRLDPVDLGYPSGELAESYYVLVQSRQGVLPGVNCGSGSHGVGQPWENPSADGLGVGEAEAELIRQQVAQEVRASVQAGGHIPHGLERWAGAYLQPRVDWRRQLAAQVRAGIDTVAGGVDYSYRRPSRRSGTPIGRAVIFPALVQPVPRLAVVVDTSASMQPAALERALAEIRGLLAACGISTSRLTVFACDTAVRATTEVFAVSQVRLAGGGGTDMGVGIECALALRPKIGAVIVLTDGFTPWPESWPPVEVVVGLIGEGPDPPPWARLIRIPAD